jgi:Protein of unknown function (DUF4238)
MTSVLNQTDLLKKLLKKFVNILYIDDMELERMNDYIFSTGPGIRLAPDDDSELYDTLDFLRDLAFDGEFTTAEQLLNYFKEQEVIIDIKIEEEKQLLAQNPPVASSMSNFVNQFTQSMKLLTCSHEHQGVTPKNVMHNLYQFVSSSADIQRLEGSYQEVRRSKLLLPMRVLRACSGNDDILPNSDHLHFENYYRSFTPSEKPYTRIISILKRIRDFFSVAARKRKGKESAKIQNLYKRIFQNIKKEQRIENDQVKMMLSRVMLIAKLNNPSFRARHQASTQNQNVKLHAEELDSVFMLNRKYYQFLNRKKWAILKSPAGLCWNTTDNPGFSIDMKTVDSHLADIVPDPYWSSMGDESVIYFPLSQEYCLRLAPTSCQIEHHDNNGSAIEFELSSEQELKVVNKLSIASKPDVVISPFDGIRKRVSTGICGTEC